MKSNIVALNWHSQSLIPDGAWDKNLKIIASAHFEELIVAFSEVMMS